MKASVFLDAFSEVLVSVAMARKHPEMHFRLRAVAINTVTALHGDAHANDTGRMFDRLWNDLQSGARQ